VPIHLRDITLADVQLGRNWLLSRAVKNWRVTLLEQEAVFLPAEHFVPTDHVLYSGLLARPSGRVTALLMFKEVSLVEYGGVYWEYVAGVWRLVGEEPDPNFETDTREFIANPLSIDPSFEADDHDERKKQREGFRRHAAALAWGVVQ